MHLHNFMYGNINRMLLATACMALFPALAGMAAGDYMVVQKSVVQLDVPSDNMLPWAAVSGTVTNHVPGYPVIIQIYGDDRPVRFAQVDVDDDGAFEYRLRVLDANNGLINRILEGSYTVEIFKVTQVSGEEPHIRA